MGRRRQRIDENPRIPFDHLWVEHYRIAHALAHNNVFGSSTSTSADLHAFSPRRHIGEGRFVVPSLGDAEALRESIERGIAHPHILFVRNHDMAESMNDRLKLPPAFPIALSDNVVSRFGFYCTTDTGRFCFHNFHSEYAARHFLDLVIDERTYKWLNDDEIELSNGTRIRGERPRQLDRILRYQMNEREQLWEPPIPDRYYWLSFARGKAISIDGSSEPVKAPRAPRAPMPDELKVHRKKLKAKSGQYITVADIAKELNVSPRDCRQALRQLKVAKPDHGWAWAPSDAEAIRNKLRKKLA